VHDEDEAGRQAKCQAQNVDKREQLVVPQMPKGDFEILDHDIRFTASVPILCHRHNYLNFCKL
jgi:hypothetical protein